jgi:hypothetical protein
LRFSVVIDVVGIIIIIIDVTEIISIIIDVIEINIIIDINDVIDIIIIVDVIEIIIIDFIDIIIIDVIDIIVTFIIIDVTVIIDIIGVIDIIVIIDVIDINIIISGIIELIDIIEIIEISDVVDIIIINIDVNEIIIMGGSAGGHLALMTGLLGDNQLFDNNCPINDKIKVAAIIDKYGITDVWAWAYNDYGTSVRKSKSPGDWLGPKKNDESFAKSVSPIWYVNKKSPPTMIIHGNADSTVPYQQSLELYEKLKSCGVKTQMITVDGGGHGKFTQEKNAELAEQIIRFIQEVLN